MMKKDKKTRYHNTKKFHMDLTMNNPVCAEGMPLAKCGARAKKQPQT